MDISNKYYDALKKIDFSNRFQILYNNYQYTDDYMSSIQKKDVLNIFNKLGYKFKFIDRSYLLLEEIGDLRIQFVINIKGNVLGYIYVWYKNELLDIVSGHFTHIRNHLENIEEFIAPTYKNHEELEKILKEYLNIYEDFKIEFIKQNAQDI